MAGEPLAQRARLFLADFGKVVVCESRTSLAVANERESRRLLRASAATFAPEAPVTGKRIGPVLGRGAEDRVHTRNQSQRPHFRQVIRGGAENHDGLVGLQISQSNYRRLIDHLGEIQGTAPRLFHPGHQLRHREQHQE